MDSKRGGSKDLKKARIAYICGFMKEKKLMWPRLVMEKDNDSLGEMYKIVTERPKREITLVSLHK